MSGTFGHLFGTCSFHCLRVSKALKHEFCSLTFKFLQDLILKSPPRTESNRRWKLELELQAKRCLLPLNWAISQQAAVGMLPGLSHGSLCACAGTSIWIAPGQSARARISVPLYHVFGTTSITLVRSSRRPYAGWYCYWMGLGLLDRAADIIAAQELSKSLSHTPR